jgi:hypothetical protein
MTVSVPNMGSTLGQADIIAFCMPVDMIWLCFAPVTVKKASDGGHTERSNDQ